MSNVAQVKNLQIAFRNLGRHRTKTVITILAVSIGFVAYLFIDAWLMGMNLDSRRNLVSYETGAAKIYSKEYLKNKDDMPLYEGFNGYQPLIDRLKVEGYNAVPHATFGGSLISASQEFPFKFIGIDPVNEPKVLKYGKYLEKDGSHYVTPGKFEIILGVKGATDLNVGVPKIIDQDIFNLDIIDKIENEDDKYFFINCYNTINIPEKIDAIVFKKQILVRIKDANDGKTLEKNYKENFMNYYLKTNPSKEEAEKIMDILSSVNYSYKSQFKLKKDLDEASLSRMWKILTDIGRNTVMLSTVIDKRDENGSVKHINQLITLTVVGVVNSPNPMTNAYIGYIPLDILQDDLGLLLEGHITELIIRKANAPDESLPSEFESVSTIGKNLNGSLPDHLAIVDWKEDAKDYLAVSQGDNVFNRIIILIFLVIAIIGIANTMLMSILERTKEIGMLRALGMEDLNIIKLFMMEAGLIGFIGSIIGVVAGAIINIWMVYYGIDFSWMLEQTNLTNAGYRMVGIYRSAWNFMTMFFCIVLGTILSSIMALLPSLKAIKLSIVDALRFE